MNKPNKSLWHYWTQFLNTITTRNSRRLIIPLGEWTVPIHEVRRRYTTYRDHTHIYTTISSGFEKKNRQTSQVQQISTLPDHMIPCLMTPFGVFPKENHEQVTQQLLPQEKEQNNPILPDNIIIVTDASVQHGVSAIAWVISDTNGIILQQKSLRLEEANMSSFSAKAYGVYSVLELQTQHSVETLKKQPGVLDFLKTQKIKIYHHKWKAEEWNVRSAGFLPRFSPLHHPKEMVVKSLNTRFKTTKNMPEFRSCKMTVFTHIYNTLLRIHTFQ
jgi:hypothetical protein